MISERQAVDRKIVEYIGRGFDREQSIELAFRAARRDLRARFDAAPVRGHAQMVIHSIAFNQAQGTAKKRRKIPRQRWPYDLEAQYSDKLIALLQKKRAAYGELIKRLPDLLRRANAEHPNARMDASDFDIARGIIDQAADDIRNDPEDIENLASYFARATSQAQRRELARQLTAALGVDVLPDESQIPQLLEYFTHENATLIESISENLHQEVAKLTARAFTKRMNPETFADLLQERFSVSESKARFLATDQIGKLWGQINAVRQRSIGVDEFDWQTRGDHKVRPTHAKLNGRRYSYDALPIVRDGQRMLPGEDFGCVPADSIVSLHASANKAFARPYRGDLTKLVSETGVAMHCTPNHPVLTTRGWIPAHLVEVGDYLVQAPTYGSKFFVENPERGDSTAAEMFGALKGLGVTQRVRAAGVGFHGDSIDQDVDVVTVDRFLFEKHTTQFGQTIGDEEFARATTSTLRGGLLEILRLGFLSTGRGDIGGSSEFLSSSEVGVVHAHEHRRASASDLDMGFDQGPTDDVAFHSVRLSESLLANPGGVQADDLSGIIRAEVDTICAYNAMLAEQQGETLIAASQPSSKLSKSEPADVEGYSFRLVKVRSTSEVFYDGVVYNFETDTGWFGLHGFIVHNCRCTAIPVVTAILKAAADLNAK